MREEHPWRLVSPWYRLPPGAGAGAALASRPVFQMYTSSDFVADFLKDPSVSLRFGIDDLVHKTVRASRRDKYRLSANEYKPAHPECRKIFLDTHARFYLVVCELHCDVAGFPNASPDHVSEAGFVIRRRSIDPPQHLHPSITEAIRRVTVARARAAAAKEALDRLAGSSPSHAFRPLYNASVRSSLADRQRRAEGERDKAQEALNSLISDHKLKLTIEGWVPSRTKGIGSWKTVDEFEGETDEHSFMLHAVVPDPRVRGHAAVGRALFFGLLPTGSRDVEAESGQPRFDDRSIYEVRCFVRRHHPACAKGGAACRCKGQRVWSDPTESYQLAPTFDLTGTSNRPVTVKLPDLQDLEAQASSLPKGKGIGVRMITPPKSELHFSISPDGLKSKATIMDGMSICSFSIPLITIVATFLLNIFLPIVVVLFNLWFLLRLKFCIFPSMNVGSDLALELSAKINAGFDFTADSTEASGYRDNLKQLFNDMQPGAGDSLDKVPDPSVPAPNFNQVAQLALDVSTDFSGSLPADIVQELGARPDSGVFAALPKLHDGLAYYESRQEATA